MSLGLPNDNKTWSIKTTKVVHAHSMCHSVYMPPFNMPQGAIVTASNVHKSVWSAVLKKLMLEVAIFCHFPEIPELNMLLVPNGMVSWMPHPAYVQVEWWFMFSMQTKPHRRPSMHCMMMWIDCHSAEILKSFCGVIVALLLLSISLLQLWIFVSIAKESTTYGSLCLSSVILFFAGTICSSGNTGCILFCMRIATISYKNCIYSNSTLK